MNKDSDIENDLETDENNGDVIDNIIDHPENHLLSDRPDATRWIIKPLGWNLQCVKLKRDDQGEVFISEVVTLDGTRHGWLGKKKKFLLPPSYEPYIHNQWYYVVPDNSEGVYISPDEQLWFIDSVGIEIRDDKEDVCTPIGPLKRAKISDALPGMIPVFDVLGKARVVDVDGPPPPENRLPYLITGSAGTGKSTLMRALRRHGLQAIDGDAFGEAVRKGRKNSMENWMRWILSELDEMMRATDLREVTDGVIDIFGAASLGLPLVPTGLHSGVAEFVESQQERGRPRHYFYDWLEQLTTDPAEFRAAFEIATEVIGDRYDDTDTEEPSVWDMDWNLDIDTIIRSLEQGISVGATGTNTPELFKRASELVKEGKIRWAHLVCGPGTTRTRLYARAKEWHESGKYPHGIKDVPLLRIANITVHDVAKVASLGAKIYGDVGGRFTPEGLARLWL